MKVKIETNGTCPSVIYGTQMREGDYGIIIARKSVNLGRFVGHYVYRAGGRCRSIIDLTEVTATWQGDEMDDIQVRLLPLGDSITITRTE